MAHAWPARFIVTLGTFLAALNYVLLAIEKLRTVGAPARRRGDNSDLKPGSRPYWLALLAVIL